MKAREVIARAGYEGWRAHSDIGDCMEPWDTEDPEITGKWYHEADAILAALAREGLAVVPVEPTEAMQFALSNAVRLNKGTKVAWEWTLAAARKETDHDE